MQTTSKLFKDIFSGDHTAHTIVEIETKVNGATQYVELGEDKIYSVSTSGSLFPEGNPSFGNFVSREIDLVIEPPTATIPRTARIRVFVYIENETQTSERIAKGTFFVDTREFNDEHTKMTIHGYDAAIKFDADFDSSDYDWPTPARSLILAIASSVGVDVDKQVSDYITDFGAISPIPLMTNASKREMMCWIAAQLGGNFTIGDNGRLFIIPLNSMNTDGDSEFGYLIDENDAKISINGTRIIISGNTADRKLVEFSKSDPLPEYTNIELYADDNTSVRAKAVGEVINGKDGVDKWFTHVNGEGNSVELSENSAVLETTNGSSGYDVLAISSPALVDYSDLLDRTVHVNFTATKVSGGTFNLIAAVGLRESREATGTSWQYSKQLTTITGTTNYSFSFVVGDWFVSEHVSGYFAIDFYLQAEGAAKVRVSSISVSVDDDSATTLSAQCPWALPYQARVLLEKYAGFQYKPFEGKGVRAFPAAELGDTIFLCGDYYTVYSQDISFGAEFVSDVSAPFDQETDHEFPYVPSAERRYTREMKTVKAELSIQATQIEAKVSSVGGDNSSFGWTLQQDAFTIYSNGSPVLKVDQTGAEITGKVVATSGEIGGCVIDGGVLKIANANIDNISATKITADFLDVARIQDRSLQSDKFGDGSVIERTIGDSAVINRTIGGGAVSYGKTSFTGTLDQVGTNQSDISAIKNYFLNILTVNTIQINGNLFAKDSDDVSHGFRPHLVTDGTVKYILGATS